ncbi:unnamed protein product [Urochloa decumbens]|uniref:Leucine-rich repeat-containing N-terminal plant-type domain-containing protein n=1 Tax=Urochloa decumbens TaxID=240449 RepID=A0ABC9AUD0_9POAL
MHPPSANFHLLLLIAATTTCIVFLVTEAGDNNVHVTCMPHEREALLSFKQGITDDPAGVLHSWHADADDCCHWRGVRCSNRTGHVLELRLGNEHAGYGYEDAALVGQISASLLGLEHLNHIDLSWNLVEGSNGRIPEFLGSFKNLKYLNLAGLQFTGSVPPQLGNLSKLQHLDLSSMSYIEQPRDLSWLTRLPLLQNLNLNKVDLSEVDDWALVVNMIPSLRVLDLSDCSLVTANQSIPHHNLTSLQELDLSMNYFDHPIASAWFWNITSLKNLNLESTHMYGHFPGKLLGIMESLQVLDVSGYAYTSKGIMMPNLKNLCSLRSLNIGSSFLYGVSTEELFENLPGHCSPSKLQELHLSGNNIHGSLPNWIGKLTSLVVLDLSQNNLTGPLPVTIGHLASLHTLDVAGNHLTGHVPVEISMLTNLTNFDLSHNELGGVIREQHFDTLKKLKYIDLSSNSLKVDISTKWRPPFRLWYADFSTCQMGPAFPAWLQWMVDIKELHISSTGIRGRIPHWFSSAFSKAIFLNVSKNQLNGGLPANLEMMSVVNLDLNSNQLTGHVPSFPKNLTTMDISMNLLSGPLPANFGPNLLELFLFKNRITGQISESICKSEELTNIDLADNMLEGELPQCFGNSAITYLDLSNNSISGGIPSSMQKCTELHVLDLSRNMFSERLPDWIGKFVRLQFLRLSHNMFFGDIPISLTNLQCLQYMDIANNSISGPLPRDLSNLRALRHKYPVGFCSKDITDDPSSLSTFLKGQQLNYGSIARIIFLNMKIIDLSLNNLTDEIPEEIATLNALVNLNLSQNHFSGNVPSRIGAIESLESLDLSRNNLSGEVPASLSNLTFLSYLDLSYNNLEGRIPSGSQLDTLYAANPDMYTGNNGLCGPPLKKNCSSISASMESNLRITKGHISELFYLGLGCGFLVGIWVVFSVLLFKDGWRISYFCLVDKLYDKVYVLFFVTWLRLITMITTK